MLDNPLQCSIIPALGQHRVFSGVESGEVYTQAEIMQYATGIIRVCLHVGLLKVTCLESVLSLENLVIVLYVIFVNLPPYDYLNVLDRPADNMSVA